MCLGGCAARWAAVKKVLVTGSRGFVGRHVLERGMHSGLRTIAAEGDLRRPRLVRSLLEDHRPAAIVHLAEKKPRVDADAWRVLADNLLMAGNLLTAVNELSPEVPVLMVGSAAQYGLGDSERLTESAPTYPVAPYGASKCVLEAAVLSEPLRRSVRVIWTRSFNHLGPGQAAHAPVAHWARQIAAAERTGGGIVRTGRLDVERDFLDVRDVADAYLALVLSSTEGVVNVCSGDAVTLSQLAEALVGLSAVPLAMVRDEALERTIDPPRVVGDPTRLHVLTGWTPSYALGDSLADVLADWRDRTGTQLVAERI
jgi:GDP-4-dehydro-6-deoxy-D-mannose reductase